MRAPRDTRPPIRLAPCSAGARCRARSGCGWRVVGAGRRGVAQAVAVLGEGGPTRAAARRVAPRSGGRRAAALARADILRGRRVGFVHPVIRRRSLLRARSLRARAAPRPRLRNPEATRRSRRGPSRPAAPPGRPADDAWVVDGPRARRPPAPLGAARPTEPPPTCSVASPSRPPTDGAPHLLLDLGHAESANQRRAALEHQGGRTRTPRRSFRPRAGWPYELGPALLLRAARRGGPVARSRAPRAAAERESTARGSRGSSSGPRGSPRGSLRARADPRIPRDGPRGRGPLMMHEVADLPPDWPNPLPAGGGVLRARPEGRRPGANLLVFAHEGLTPVAMGPAEAGRARRRIAHLDGDRRPPAAARSVRRWLGLHEWRGRTLLRIGDLEAAEASRPSAWRDGRGARARPPPLDRGRGWSRRWSSGAGWPSRASCDRREGSASRGRPGVVVPRPRRGASCGRRAPSPRRRGRGPARVRPAARGLPSTIPRSSLAVRAEPKRSRAPANWRRASRRRAGGREGARVRGAGRIGMRAACRRRAEGAATGWRSCEEAVECSRESRGGSRTPRPRGPGGAMRARRSRPRPGSRCGPASNAAPPAAPTRSRSAPARSCWRPASGPARRLPGGVESLTASERRTTALASEGQTNRQIAQALFVTPKTVEVHLRNAYRKLGIRSRRELRPLLEAAAG